MNEKYIAIPKELPGFSSNELAELSETYESMGYKYRQPQMGGGGAKIVTQTVAWLNEKSFFSSLFLIIATATTKKLFEKARIWYKSNHLKTNKNIINVININYSGTGNDFWLELDISKKYTLNDLKLIIKNAKKRGRK